MALQTSPQAVQASIPPDAYGMDANLARGQFSQQSPRIADPYRSAASPQSSSKRPSRRPSGNAAQSSSPSTPQQLQPHGQDSSNPSSSITVRADPTTAATYGSPVSPIAATSSPRLTGPREQRKGQDRADGPSFPVPPRSSSNHNQKGTTATAQPETSIPYRTTSSQPGRGNDDQGQPARLAESSESRRRGDEQRSYNSGDARYDDFTREDPATTAAVAARERRRGPTSPEAPQRSASSRDAGTRSSPATAPAGSTANAQAPTPPAKIARENSAVINRVVLDDPQVDLGRERERIADAIPSSPGADITPVTGLGLVGSEGVDDGGRGGAATRTRQDHSQAAARRKETKFGEYVLGQTLGEGEFGKVKLGWKKDGSVQVAIKLIRRENLNTNPSRLPKIYREITILSKLQHPNIVRLHEMVETDRHIGIILEYASGGELFDYILTHRYLKDNAARRLFAQLVSGVGYLHKKGIVHRDLKLENLLLDRNRNIIITDFGFANTFDPRDELGEEIEYNLTNRDYVKKMDLERTRDGIRRGDLMQTSCGSPCYAAPELVVTDSLYTGRKVDVWSCGVILYAMLAGYLPFDDDPANPEGDNINLLYKYIVSTALTFPEYVTPHARDLLRRILVPDPRKRADLFEVARHSWLSEYAHVVAHVTSTTTTVEEIANPSIAPNHLETPLLARSASVREPSKPVASSMSPVGGLNHQGKIDPEQTDKKAPRDPKRRTVQVEYVAPQSQTIRGELSPPLDQPVNAAGSTSRARSGSQSAADSHRKVSAAASAWKPLPQDPPRSEGYPQMSVLESAVSSNRTQRPTTSGASMQAPVRPAREPPRSVSESTGAFGLPAASTIARPNTGGSMSSTGGGRLPSRGNSYSQPLEPTTVATNAQGKLAQPKGGRQYTISAPIPQSEPYITDSSFGLPTNQRVPGRYSQAPPPRDEPKFHKRSNTLTNVFGRSGSFFGGKSSQPQSPVEQPQGRLSEKSEKRYPPTSMKAPIAASDSPRQSTDSRRRPSFSFSRKNSDIGKVDKPRRFSLLPASFSLKNFTAGPSKEHVYESSMADSERKQSLTQQSASQGMGFSRGPNQKHSQEHVAVYDGNRDTIRTTSAPTARREVPVRGVPQSQSSQFPQSQYASLEMNPPDRPMPQGQSHYINASGPPTESDISVNRYQSRPRYPQGFNSYDEDPRASMQQGGNGNGRGVLQKPNRKFADVYDQGQGPGHHSGSSGAAKRVMDFFRRRGKARPGDD